MFYLSLNTVASLPGCPKFCRFPKGVSITFGALFDTRSEVWTSLVRSRTEVLYIPSRKRRGFGQSRTEIKEFCAPLSQRELRNFGHPFSITVKFWTSVRIRAFVSHQECTKVLDLPCTFSEKGRPKISPPCVRHNQNSQPTFDYSQG